MIKPIVKDVFFLGQKSGPATKQDLSVGQDLQDTLTANQERCVGMAANMIGVRKRIIIVNIGFMNLVMYNPVLLKKDTPYETEEGCLSLEGVRKAKRYQNKILKEVDRSLYGKEHVITSDSVILNHFSFLDGLQDLILIAAAIDNAKDNDIRFLLIDQVIGNIIFHQNTPHVIPFQIRVVDRPACFWCLTDFFQFLFQFIRKGGGGIGIYQVTRDIVKGLIDISLCALRQNVIISIRCHVSPSAFSVKTHRL